MNNKYKYIQAGIALGILSVLVIFAYFTSRMITFSLFLTYFTLGYFLIVSLIAYTYRNFRSDITPECDVIIPAYNEGACVYNTVKYVCFDIFYMQNITC